MSVEMESHTVGPASSEVPESAIAEQPPAQSPESIKWHFFHK